MKKQFEQYLNDIKSHYHVADSQLLKDEVLSDDSGIYYHVTSIENKDSILKNGFLLEKANKSLSKIYFTKGIVAFPRMLETQQIVLLVDLSSIEYKDENNSSGDVSVVGDISPEVIFGWIVIGKAIESNGTRKVVYDKYQG